MPMPDLAGKLASVPYFWQEWHGVCLEGECRAKVQRSESMGQVESCHGMRSQSTIPRMLC